MSTRSHRTSPSPTAAASPRALLATWPCHVALSLLLYAAGCSSTEPDDRPADADSAADLPTAGTAGDTPAPNVPMADPSAPTDPSAGSHCKPGVYRGEYDAIFTTTLDPFQSPLPVTGPLSFDLAIDSEWIDENSEFPMLVTRESAQFESSFFEPAVVTRAALDGGIDCTDLIFSATSTTCAYELSGIPSGDCTITFTGTFNPETDTIEGDVEYAANLGEGLPIGFGSGTFTLQLGP